jgi:signal transduction histidine kinase
MAARHCLLVVDDEPEVVQSLQDLLRFDYRVLGAHRPSEGMRVLDREEVHVVMTDQRMPEMTGVEFVQQLHQNHPDVVPLLFTGYADVQAVIAAINQGSVFRYIAKPWDVDELRTVLRQATERYDLLIERRRLLEELQEKNRRLEALNAELHEANELKLSFIKVASHELRTPLTVVMGLSELARQQPIGDESVQQWIDQIYEGSRRLNERVDQIVSLLLAGNFKRPLARTDVDLAGLLAQAAGEVGPFIARRKQVLDVQPEANLGTLAIERDKIQDTLVHLLINAIKFTPDGGTIRLSARRLPSRAVEIRVTDTGIGIDASHKKHIFDPFFTEFDVSRHTSGVFEFRRHGMGLGLPLVKAFVEMHRGTVEVSSAVGAGTTFVITLPEIRDEGFDGVASDYSV